MTNTSYTVALWPTRLAPLPVATIPIEAETPRLAALMAMKTHGSDAMGVVVVLDAEKQTTYFDARLEENELHFSKAGAFSRFSPDPLLENSKKWRA